MFVFRTSQSSGLWLESYLPRHPGRHTIVEMIADSLCESSAIQCSHEIALQSLSRQHSPSGHPTHV
jgi:hypothetical protein